MMHYLFLISVSLYMLPNVSLSDVGASLSHVPDASALRGFALSIMTWPPLEGSGADPAFA